MTSEVLLSSVHHYILNRAKVSYCKDPEDLIESAVARQLEDVGYIVKILLPHESQFDYFKITEKGIASLESSYDD